MPDIGGIILLNYRSPSSAAPANRPFMLKMRPFTVVLLALLSGCVDGERISGIDDPVFPVGVALAPVFMNTVTSVPAQPITHVRMTATDILTGNAVGSTVVPVDANDATWLLELTVEVPAQTVLTVKVELVLMSGDQTAGVAEWSGRTGELKLSASTPTRDVQSLAVYRGPPANLSVTGIEASVPGELVDGDRMAAQYSVQGGGNGVQVYMRSLDPEVVDVDGGVLVGRSVGTGRVIAEAGPAVDTFSVAVAPWPLPPREQVEAAGPGLDDSATRLLGGLSDAAGSAAISQGLADVASALEGASAGNIFRAIETARAAISGYNGGNWGADGPELSLVGHSLDVLELTLRSTRGN